MFYLANNPFLCDCKLSWLKQMHTYGLGSDVETSMEGSTDLGRFHNVLQYPHVADLDLTTCEVINQTACPSFFWRNKGFQMMMMMWN